MVPVKGNSGEDTGDWIETVDSSGVGPGGSAIRLRFWGPWSVVKAGSEYDMSPVCPIVAAEVLAWV